MCRAPHERHDFMAFDIRIAYLLVVAVGGIHLWVFIWRRRTGKDIEIILIISFYPILPTTTLSCTFPNHPLLPYPLLLLPVRLTLLPQLNQINICYGDESCYFFFVRDVLCLHVIIQIKQHPYMGSIVAAESIERILVRER
jgi:hypothetical protein